MLHSIEREIRSLKSSHSGGLGILETNPEGMKQIIKHLRGVKILSFGFDVDEETGYRVQPVAAGCIIGWDAAFAADAVSPYQYTGAHFADLGRMTG